LDDPKFPIDKSGLIRKFDFPSLNSQIDKAISELDKEGKHGAVVVVANMDEVRLAIIGKKEIGPGDLAWTVIGVNKWDDPNGPTIEGQVRYSWP
jgi:hypothetical protein